MLVEEFHQLGEVGERVELQVEIMFGGFAGVDRAAGGFSGGRRHHWAASTWSASRLMRRPKKRGPFHAVPVMARATVVRLGKVCPCQTKPLGTTVTVWRTPRCSRIRTVPGLSRGPASSFSAFPRTRPSSNLMVALSWPP